MQNRTVPISNRKLLSTLHLETNKIVHLSNCVICFVSFPRHHFEGYPQLAEQTNYLKEYIELLEQQLQIEVKAPTTLLFSSVYLFYIGIRTGFK